jgi:hypothetical protein
MSGVPRFVIWENDASRPVAEMNRLLTRQACNTNVRWGRAEGFSMTQGKQPAAMEEYRGVPLPALHVRVKWRMYHTLSLFASNRCFRSSGFQLIDSV